MASVRDRAILIFELLVRHVRGLPMHEIADRLGIPRTAAHRLLGELKAMGYVKQEPGSTQYMLTLRLAALGLSYLSASGISDAAQPLLDELAEQTGELTRLGLWEGEELTWVAKAQGARTGLRYDPDSGAEVYLPASASGLALLASLPDAQVLALIAKQGLSRIPAMGPGAPASMPALLACVEQTRARGYAVVIEAYEAGTSALAAVVRRAEDAEPVGTVSIAGPSTRLTPARLTQLAPAVLASAAQMAAISLQSPTFRRGPGAVGIR